MTQFTNKTTVPPSITDLMVSYLSRSEDAVALCEALGNLGEVEPHEVSVGYRSEPRAAWNEGVAVLKLFSADVIGVSPPSEWAALVLRSESVAGLPMACANFPQRVRDLTKLLGKKDLSTQVSESSSEESSLSLKKWAASMAKKGPSFGLLGVGILRLAGDTDAAEELLLEVKSGSDSNHHNAIENEQAAIFWQQGKAEAALSIWRELDESVPTLFNRGMAALFVNQRVEARDCLKKVLAQLPDSNSWHHLAGLYLAIAEM